MNSNYIRLISALTLLLVMSCSGFTIEGNYLGVSRSSKESEKEGLLIEKYHPKNKVIRIDSLGKSFRIKEVFVEKRWRSVPGEGIRKTRGYQVIIVSRNQLPPEYSFEWMMGLSPKIMFSTLDKKILVADIETTDLLQDSILEATIYQGDIAHFKSKPNRVSKKKINLK